MTPKTIRLVTWDGPLPELGNHLRTKAGSMYLVIEVKPNTRPDPKSVAKVSVLKLTEDEKKDVPTDTVMFDIWWTNRKGG